MVQQFVDILKKANYTEGMEFVVIRNAIHFFPSGNIAKVINSISGGANNVYLKRAGEGLFNRDTLVFEYPNPNHKPID